MVKSFTVDIEDFKKYRKFAIRKLQYPVTEKVSTKSRGLVHQVINVLVWVAVGLICSSLYQSLERAPFSFHWPSGLLVALPLIVLFTIFWWSFKVLEQRTIPKENGLMIGRRTVEVLESGLTEKGDLGSSEYRWEAVEEVVLHERNVYIVLDSVFALIVPSSAFASEMEAEEYYYTVKEMHNKILQKNAVASSE